MGHFLPRLDGFHRFSILVSKDGTLLLFLVSQLNCFLWCENRSKNTAQSAFSLKLLRSMTILSSTVLFLPFVSFLLQTFQCGDRNRWVLGPGSVCFGLTHIIFITLMAMVLPCFILVSIFIASVFFERDFKENVINAQIHGKFM